MTQVIFQELENPEKIERIMRRDLDTMPLGDIEVSRSLENGDLVTFREGKAIKWSHGQKLMGVYENGSFLLQGVIGVSPADYRALILDRNPRSSCRASVMAI